MDQKGSNSKSCAGDKRRTLRWPQPGSACPASDPIRLDAAGRSLSRALSAASPGHPSGKFAFLSRAQFAAGTVSLPTFQGVLESRLTPATFEPAEALDIVSNCRTLWISINWIGSDTARHFREQIDAIDSNSFRNYRGNMNFRE